MVPAGSSFVISSSLRAEIVTEPARDDAGRRRDAHANLEIRRRQTNEITFRLDQYVGEDRHRLARLDDVVNHLEASEKCIAIHMDFHKRLRC